MVEWIVSSSVLIAVVILLRFVLKGKISLRLQYALWALVLVRLLVPVSFGDTAMSVGNLTQKAATSETAQLVSALSETELPRMTYQAAYNEVAQEYADRGIQIEEMPLEEYAETVDYEIMNKMNGDLSIAEVIKIIWICGIALVGVWFLFSNLRLHRSLKKARTLLTDKHALPVYLSNAIDTPCLFGLFHPAIYLTSEAIESEHTQRHAVEHELTHFRHKDNIWAILRSVCLAVHWFNPLVWYAAVLSRNDAELACDESTILRMGESERASYGRTLIHLTCEKRPALLNTATTMTGSGKSIKERIALIVKKPKMAGYTLAAVILITVFAVGCTFTGASKPSETPDESGTTATTGQYASVEDYVMKHVESIHMVDFMVWKTPFVELADEPFAATVINWKLAYLEQQGSLDGLDPNGTLEAWEYDYLVKPNPSEIDSESIVLAGGMYIDEYGYVCMSNKIRVMALRYPDGSYDILGEEPYGDGLDFFGYHHNTQESIYDWYVAKNNLNLPLYVEDWIDLITVPEGGRLGNFPVHRFDGDGWYIYVPVSAWIMQEPSKDHWEWYSEYDTASVIVVDRFTQSLEDEYIVSRTQDFVPLDDTNQVWGREQGGVNERYYFHPAEDGDGCYRVWTLWTDEGITDYPYIAMEPDVLHLMAESFTVTEKKSNDGTVVKTDSLLDDAYERALPILAGFTDWTTANTISKDTAQAFPGETQYAIEFPVKGTDWFVNVTYIRNSASDGWVFSTAEALTWTPTSEADVQEIINHILVGALSYDESWQSAGAYTLTVSGADGRTDTYSYLPETHYSLMSTPGYYVNELYDWSLSEAWDDNFSNSDYILTVSNDLYSLTVYSQECKMKIEEADGITMYFVGTPREEDPNASIHDYERLFLHFRQYAMCALEAYELHICSVDGSETDYEVIAQELSEQYARILLDRPKWYHQLAQDAKVSAATVFDAYYGADQPNFCFRLGLYLKIPEEQTHYWQSGAGLSDPPAGGEFAGYYGYGSEVSVGKAGDGRWRMEGFASGGSWAHLPVAPEEATTQQLIDMFFLTSGFSRDWHILSVLVERPLAEVQKELGLLNSERRDELSEAILIFIEENPDYRTWTSKDFTGTPYDEVRHEKYPDGRIGERFVLIRQGSYWGLSDGNYQTILEPERYALESIQLNTYEEVWPILPVQKDGCWGAIDYYGNMVIEPAWNYIQMFIYEEQKQVFVHDGEGWRAISLTYTSYTDVFTYEGLSAGEPNPEWTVSDGLRAELEGIGNHLTQNGY